MKARVALAVVLLFAAGVLHAGSNALQVKNVGTGNFTKSRAHSYLQQETGAPIDLGTIAGVLAPGATFTAIQSYSWGAYDRRWWVTLDGGMAAERNIVGASAIGGDIFLTVVGDGESFPAATNFVTVCNPLNHPVKFWYRVDGVDQTGGNIEQWMIPPGECVTWPIMTQDEGHLIEAGYEDLEAVANWDLDNGWTLTNFPNQTVQTIVTNGPTGWQNAGTNVWQGTGGTQPWRTLTNSSWSPIDWSSGGSPGVLAASDYTLRAGFNGMINAQREGDGLLAAVGSMIVQGLTNLAGEGGTNTINITNTPATNSLDWTEGRSNWVTYAEDRLYSTNFLDLTVFQRTYHTNQAGVGWGSAPAVSGAGEGSGFSFSLPLVMNSGSNIVLSNTMPFADVLGPLCRILMAWFLVWTLWKDSMTHLEEWYKVVIVVPQATTAGTTILGVNLNVGNAFAMGCLIVACIATVPAIGIAMITDTLGGVGGVGGVSWNQLPSLGPALSVFCTFFPLATFGACMFSACALRLATNVLGGTIAAAIRLLSGL